jgi:hypothetical protein
MQPSSQRGETVRQDLGGFDKPPRSCGSGDGRSPRIECGATLSVLVQGERGRAALPVPVRGVLAGRKGATHAGVGTWACLRCNVDQRTAIVQSLLARRA